MNRRWVCNDVWMDMFPHFDRPQLGLKLAILSPRFNALVDKHFDGKKELPIWRPIRIDMIRTTAKVFVEKNNGKTMQFPMPNKIRFENLQIEYIDHSFITFLRANQKIWDKGTNLNLSVPSFSYNPKDVQPIWDVFAREIWPIFAPNIRHLSFSNCDAFEHLCRHTSPTVLTDFNIISINSGNLLPDSIADDGPNATISQALSKWLQIPTKDGKPKQLRCSDFTSRTNEFVNDFKEAFFRATIFSARYIIRIDLFYKSTPNEPFELINERTNELLTLEKKEGDHGNIDVVWLLKRCQIGRTIQWEDGNPSILNNVNFTLVEDYSIGPLSPPKTGKKNAKSPLEMNPGPSGEQKKK